MQKRIRAAFVRGGTSKGLVFRASDLPVDPPERDRALLRAMGSPDPYGRQLDGMGGGLSSLSKICIVGPASRSDADVDYTFGQVGIGDAVVDYAGNCGNMSSAIGPFAVEEGLVATPPDGEATVRIHNTNTGKIIVSRFQVRGGQPVVDGDFALDGVAGTAAPIRLEFLEPGGAKTGKLLSTGQAIDIVDVPGLGPVEVSLVDAANPMVFVAAHALDCTGVELPDEIAANATLMQRLEAVRTAASVIMGLAPDLAAARALTSIPKVAMLAPPMAAPLISGNRLTADEVDITARTISVGQPHRAIPLTSALCLAVAIRIPGSLAARLASGHGNAHLRIGHPSGTISVDAVVETSQQGIHVRHATVLRTARRLFDGHVCVPVEPS